MLLPGFAHHWTSFKTNSGPYVPVAVLTRMCVAVSPLTDIDRRNELEPREGGGEGGSSPVFAVEDENV